jgi:hypothetical protein
VDRAGVLRLGHRAFGPGEHAVIAVVDPGAGLAVVRAAAADGADIAEVAGRLAGDPSAAGFAAELREAFPELLIGVRAGPAAAEIGGVVVGPPVLVSLPGQDLAGSLAVAAVAAWEGARVFRAGRPGWVRATRRALRMAAAIRGDVPPASALRGLA